VGAVGSVEAGGAMGPTMRTEGELLPLGEAQRGAAGAGAAGLHLSVPGFTRGAEGPGPREGEAQNAATPGARGSACPPVIGACARASAGRLERRRQGGDVGPVAGRGAGGVTGSVHVRGAAGWWLVFRGAAVFVGGVRMTGR
jgi:hypothetical protein